MGPVVQEIWWWNLCIFMFSRWCILRKVFPSTSLTSGTFVSPLFVAIDPSASNIVPLTVGADIYLLCCFSVCVGTLKRLDSRRPSHQSCRTTLSVASLVCVIANIVTNMKKHSSKCFEWHLICRQPKQRWSSFNPHPMEKQHPRNSQISQALPQIRKIKHFRQQPPFTRPLDSSNSHFSKCWVLVWGLSRPLNPVILTPCSQRHDIPDLSGPLETHFNLLSFLLWLHPPARTRSLRRSVVCFGVRELEEEIRSEGGGRRLQQRGWVGTIPEWNIASCLGRNPTQSSRQ